MTPSTNSTEPERVQKYLSRAGVASRRKAEELIRAGRVAVNGEAVASLATKILPGLDVITVDGVPASLPQELHYLLVNKPAGVVTTLEDPQGRPTVAQFIPRGGPRLFPVGRLDQNTTGLLLMTNDGELAHALMHPRFHVPKTYRAVVDGIPDEGDLGRLRAGIELDDGRTAPAEAHVAGSEPGSTTVLLTLREGRKRQVRRMFSAIGHPVTALARVAYGPLTDEGLAVGGVRELGPDEVEALRASVGGGD